MGSAAPQSEDTQPRSVAASARVAAFLMELRAQGIRDLTLLQAVERTPRETFLPPALSPLAYFNVEAPIACGQTALAPRGLIQRIAVMQPEKKHIVLEIGAGSGFQTAVLAHLVKRVFSVERFRTLADRANARLSLLGLANAVVRQGDGAAGMAQSAPFNRVFINAAVPEIPAAILSQLADEARVLAPLKRKGETRMVMTQFTGGARTETDLGPIAVSPLEKGGAAVL